MIPMFRASVFAMIEPLAAVYVAHDDTELLDDLSNRHLDVCVCEAEIEWNLIKLVNSLACAHNVENNENIMIGFTMKMKSNEREYTVKEKTTT